MPSWKIVAGVTALCLLAAVTLIWVGYAMTPIPTKPQDSAIEQGSAIYYKDGKTPIARLGAHRETVTLDKVPEHVRNAVIAAEDRGFWTEHGVSPKGLSRAIWKSATGGDVQGGSTITQQLARNYFQGLSQDRTFSRKFKEIFISIKLADEMSKEKILEMYLNTVFFGRNSNGIQAAARAYFHKDVGQLNVAQGAMLAAMIQQPAYFETRGNGPAAQALKSRFSYVLDGMVKMGKLSEADRQKQVFPRTQYNWSDVKNTGQTVYIQNQVQRELSQIKGITQKDLDSKGMKIYTSLEPKWMKYAAEAMKEEGVGKWPKNIGTGLIAIDPRDGTVKAFYGGNPEISQYDTVFNDSAQVGSSFKPYVLATALKNGFSIKSTIDGHSPQTFAPNGDSAPRGQGYTVNNDEGDGPMGVINLVKATEMSVNTAYVKLGLKLGLSNVTQTARDFGIPYQYLKPHENLGGLSLGIANIPAAYQASSYAAFANGGKAVTPHIVTRVVKDGKEIKLPWIKKPKEVMTEDQAAQATLAMKAVVNAGTGKRARLPDREAAGKTGTTDENHAAWFVGYIPQLSAAVTMFNKKDAPISGIDGYQGSSIYGGTIPAKIWRSFMMKVIQGENMAVVPFKTPTYEDSSAKAWDTPKPTNTPTEKPTEPPNCDEKPRGNKPKPPECPPDSPSIPPPSHTPKQPCMGGVQPPACDPEVMPPLEPWKTRWCNEHDWPKECGKKPEEPGGPGGPGGPGSGNTQAIASGGRPDDEH